MPHFVRLTSFTSDGAKDMKNFASRRKEFLATAQKLKMRIIAEYVLAGKYDILTILEAPDLATVMRLSAMMGLGGRTRTETLGAIPADEFEKISQSI